MATINYQTRQKIIAQALKEIEFARNFKQGKTKNWKTNEDLYYSRKNKSLDSRANVDLGQMSSFVHTILSKIDNPLTFKLSKRKESQLKRVNLLNRLRQIDAEKDNWDIKDIVGKKQCTIYGRAIYSYYAESDDGYESHLDNVDVYDFLIDPSAGGVDIESAYYMGRYGVVKQKYQLEEGVKNKFYLRTETQQLIDGSGNATDVNQEMVNKQNRTYDQNVWNSTKQISNPDKYVFWEWYTTFEGKRYYLLLNERGATAIRIELLSDIFESNMFPFWTYAAFPDLTEFWTPSFCDYVRDIFMAQAVSINQSLDNAEQINKPQKVVNLNAIENLAQLKYRKDGIIGVRNDIDANRAVQVLQTPSIQTPIQVFQLLETIQEKASGVTSGAKGLSSEDKVGIYQGNQANAADRFGFLNRSYSFGYKHFAMLWVAGVKEHLIKKVAVDVLGPDGIEIENVSRKDLFKKGDDDYGVVVEASTAELQLSEIDKRNKVKFLASQTNSPIQNPKKAYELQASIVGFDDDTIRQLMDKSEFGVANIMAEAERDIEDLIDGKNIPFNQGANNAYKQRFVDYITNNQEFLTPEQFYRLSAYVDGLEKIIFRNMQRTANELLMKQQMDAVMSQEPQPMVAKQPTAPNSLNVGGTGDITNNNINNGI